MRSSILFQKGNRKMKIYNKLVRDKIPDIIQAKGEKAVVREIPQENMMECLKKKLFEEVQEYLEAGNVEELADILEVFLAILDNTGLTYEELDKLRIQKATARGGFSKRIYLEYVVELSDRET